MSGRVLLVDDDKAVREALGQTLELADLKPVLAGSFIEAKDHIAKDFPGIVVSDIRMPGQDGFALLEHVQRIDPDLPVILLTGEGDIPMAVKGMSAGAFDFLEKPCAPRDLLAVVAKALKTRELVLANRRLKTQLASGDAAARMLLGGSARAEALRAEVRAVARTSAEVLITGEPGTGTSKVAEVIHLLSGAAMRSFQKCACISATPESLSVAFEASRGGTLFLDGVGGLSPGAQMTALDLLDSNPGVRLIAATHRDLQEEAQQGRFSAELYYKLDVMRVRIPALRERPEDIALLFRHYVATACEQAALPEPDIGTDVIARLMAQDWPGNARSLMNAAMRFAMGLGDADSVQEQGLSEQLAQVERSLLIAALQQNGGNATETAQALKLPRKTFYDKLARHGLRAETYR